MAYDPLNSPSQAAGYASSKSIDAGLQSDMQSVYRTMCWGLGVTGLTAYGVANVPVLSNFVLHPGTSMIVMLGTFIFLMVGFRPGRIAQASAESLRLTFLLFSALMGLMLSIVFEVYTGTSIARAFFITAGAFAGTSLYGYTTRRDLTGMGSFMFMGLLGIIIAGFVNMLLQSTMMYFVTSVLSVVIFTGLAAWETQKLKYMYRAGDTEGNGKQAVMGALSLYMNFINLFQAIISLTGDRR